MNKYMWAIVTLLAMAACGADPTATGMQLPPEVAALPAPENGKLEVKGATLSSSWCWSNSECSDDLTSWLYEHTVDSSCVTNKSSWCSSGTCKGSMTIDFLCSSSDDSCSYDWQCGTGYACYLGICVYNGGYGYGGSCNDSDYCTYNDTYQYNGSCQGTRYTCDDGISCTTDSCYVSGSAAYCRNLSTSCDDYNSCTTDWCSSGGSCQHSKVSNCCRSSSDCASGYSCSSGSCVWNGYNGGGYGGNVAAIVYAEIVTAPSFNVTWADFYGQFCSWGSMSNYGTPNCYQSGFNRSWSYLSGSSWVSENSWNRKVTKVQLTVPEGARQSSGFLIGSLVVGGNRNVWYPETPSGAPDVQVRFLNYAGQELSKTIYNSNNGGYVVKVALSY